ncbi:171_t:CDS:2 [Paraglomus brasilianum]|uniref:171_t:CDS:1 n=1 Tax=Paraglomus brasilianum TaxID=144538 RepID=A0A9N8ZQM9_9GLOM|nr:171_t:CDS:2 [Paraglomus brasilianum]
MSALITHRKPGRKSKTFANLDFTDKITVMLTERKTEKVGEKMLPVTTSLENSIDNLENLSKELVHAGDPNENNIGFVAKDAIDKKELATMSFSRLRRGRKRRTVPKELDFTGNNPIMVVEHPKKRRMAEEGADYKEEQLSVMLEKSADIVDECKTVVNYRIGREELAQMTTEELGDYAKFFATALTSTNLTTATLNWY